MKIASFAVAGWLIVLAWMFWPQPSPSDQVVTEWFKYQQMGLPGVQFWADGTDPVVLYAVRSWEVILSSSTRYTVRVESSTREGFPIIRLWKICLEGDKIVSVEPAQV